jgi:hypothetical protein
MLSTQNSKSRMQFEVVDPESGDADLFQIKKTAQNIRERMGKINAAEHWVAIGGELAALRKTLAKPVGRRGHNERIGWRKACELGILPFTKEYANALISIYEFLREPTVPLTNYPSSYKPLKVLETKFKDRKLVQKLVDDGKITAASTERGLLNLAHELGLVAKKVTVPVNRDSPKGRRVIAALKYVQRLGLTISDLKQGDK